MQRCTGANEVYSLCDNNNCQPTCNRLIISGCTSTCTPGCICSPGYFRNALNICVPPGECREFIFCIFLGSDVFIEIRFVLIISENKFQPLPRAIDKTKCFQHVATTVAKEHVTD